MTTTDDVISTLNNLIETCKDGQSGFQTAAEGITSGELKTLLHTYAQQRAQFSGELQDEVRRLGGDPEQAGSVTATLHRGWINIKSAITGQDESSILAECERGEDAAVSNYHAALETDLPAHIRSVVERQYTQVKDAHDRIRALEKASGAASA